MNDTDSQILGLLQDNARISITEIANKLYISRNTVQKRIEYLAEKRNQWCDYRLYRTD